MRTQTSELKVITQAQELLSYVFVITQKSPKKFRFSIVGRMQDLALEVLEKLFRANEIFPNGTHKEELARARENLQEQAVTAVKLLGYMGFLAMEQQAITAKQYEVFSRHIANTQYFAKAWLTKDRQRYGLQ